MNKNVKIFKETMQHIWNDPMLTEAAIKSKDALQGFAMIREDDVDLPHSPGKAECMDAPSFRAARETMAEGKKTAVLDFANPIEPGGGVLRGAYAQEENLCRCSTLYPALISEQASTLYYTNNRRLYQEHQDYHKYSGDVLYVPNIWVFQDDRDYTFIEPYCVDVIVCAAPVAVDFYSGRMTEEEQVSEMRYRANAILKAAYENSADILILGAIGCGDFGNKAKCVATAWKEAIEKYGGNFSQIIFPMTDKQMMESFQRVFEK